VDLAELTQRLRRRAARPTATPAVLIAVSPARADHFAGVLRPGDVVATCGDGVLVLCERLEAVDDARPIAGRIDGRLRAAGVDRVGIWLRELSDGEAAQELDDLDADARPMADSTGWAAFDDAARRAVAARVPTQDELHLAYQPVVELRTGRMIGVEALLRSRHLGREVLPEEFVPAAEAAGSIVELGAWAMRRACEQAGEWRGNPMLSDLRVGVNVSARQLAEPAFGDRVADALAAGSSPLEPELLWVELTESLVLDDLDAVVPVLERLRSNGVRVALDDFGTGYSSLTHLRRLPVDVIKLDRSFVAQMDSDRRDRAIVRSSIGLAAALGLRCVAEGVANRRHVDQLIDMGCEYGQGSWFSLPVAAEEVPDVARTIAERAAR